MVDDQTAQNELRAAVSSIIQRYQFAREHGMSFNGKRDLYEVLGYGREVTPKELRSRYDRGGIAGRIVDAFPYATWRGGVEIIEDPDKYDPHNFTEFEKVWNLIVKKFKVWMKFQQLDILAGQGRYAVMLIGAEGDLSTPLPKATATSGILYLTNFSEEDAPINEWEQDSTSPRFGLPKTYKLKRVNMTSADFSKPVHWTRVLHVCEGNLDDDVYGRPRLQRVWNLLDDLEKVTGGGAEAFWLRANRGLHLDIDKEIKEISPEKKTEMREQAELFANQMERVLRTRGTKVTDLGSDVADFGPPSDAILTQIAGSIGIPKRILTGSEMGQLASTQDRDNWDTQVQDRRDAHADPVYIEPFVQRLIDLGYVPKPAQFSSKWPTTKNLTELEKTQGADAWATINQKMGRTIFTDDEIRDHWHGMEPVDVSGIEDVESVAAEQEQVNRLEAAMRSNKNLQLVIQTK